MGSWTYKLVFVIIILILPAADTLAGVGNFGENFTTQSYMDTTYTVAWWDTSMGGRLRLLPFEITQLDSLHLSSSPNTIDIAGTTGFIAAGDAGIIIINIADPDSMEYLTTYDTPGQAYDVAIFGEYAFVADGTAGLLVLNISDPSIPELLGVYDTPGTASGIAIAGDLIYLADITSLQVINVTSPDTLVCIGSLSTPGEAHHVDVAGNFAYVATGYTGIAIVDIKDPTQLSLHGECNTPGFAQAVIVKGDHAYVADEYSLQVLDISDPHLPEIVGSYTVSEGAIGLDVAGDYIYITSRTSGLLALDLSNPSSPRYVGNFESGGAVTHVSVAGEHAFAVRNLEGSQTGTIISLHVADIVIPPLAMGRLAWDGAPRRVTLSGNYAFVGDEAGGDLKVIDVSDPRNLHCVVTLDTPGDAKTVAIAGDYAYVADGNPALLVLDISSPDDIVAGGSVQTVGEAYDVVIDEGYAYVADGVEGLTVIDISNPEFPSHESNLYLGGHVDRFSFAIDVEGNYAYIADNVLGLRVIDISNPSSPQNKGYFTPPGTTYDLAVIDTLAYMVGPGGLDVVSIVDPLAPTLIGSVDIPGMCRGVDVAGTIAYVASDGGGMFVVDISNPSLPAIIGSYGSQQDYFDVSVSGSHAYVVDHSYGLVVIDIGIPTAPDSAGSFDGYIFAPSSAFVRVTVSEEIAYLVDNMHGLQLIDISNPLIPARVGYCTIQDGARSVAIDGDFAYIAHDEWGVFTVDISDSTRPRIPYMCDGPGYSHGVAIHGDLAFVTTNGPMWDWGGIQVYDISDPPRPEWAGSLHSNDGYYPQYMGDLILAGDHAYVAAGGLFQSVNISDPIDPYRTGSVPYGCKGLAVDSNRAYLASNFYGLKVVDLSIPDSPTMIGQLYTQHGIPNDVEVVGQHAFVASLDRGLFVVSVADPTNPLVLGANDEPSMGYGIAVSGDHAYLADYDEGLWVFSVFSRESQPDSNSARSTVLDASDNIIARAAMQASYSDSIIWELSSDSTHDSWYDVIPGGPGCVFMDPGPDLLWRAELLPLGAAGSPVCDSLFVEWWYQAPFIESIDDIPGDQGGWTRISFTRSGYDFEDDASPVDEYAVWRRVESRVFRDQARGTLSVMDRSKGQSDKVATELRLPDLGPGYSIFYSGNRAFAVADVNNPKGFERDVVWEYVAYVPALQQETYTVAVPTTLDSSDVDVPWSVFRVSGHRADPTEWYVSQPDSGYSIDDTAPSAPIELKIIATNTLGWEANEESDLEFYTIYGFLDESRDQIICLEHTTETICEIPGNTVGYYIYVTATDLSGNESDPSEALLNTGQPLPLNYSLSQNVPNPFNPITLIRFALPKPGPAKLTIYNVSGRQVCMQPLGTLPAGHHEAHWNGRDDHGHEIASGVYFYVLEVNEFVEKRKMVLLR